MASMSLSIHYVKDVKLDTASLLETGTYVRHIYIETDAGTFSIALFADEKETLKFCNGGKK